MGRRLSRVAVMRGARAAGLASLAVLAALAVTAGGSVPAHAETPSEPTASPAEAAPVDELRIPFPQDDGTLTPYTFEVGYSLVTLVYDTLLWRDADGEPQPWLAESIETSDNGRRVTVELAADARWHDDQPVTSQDVAFTFEFVADRFHPRFTGQLDAIDNVATPDEHTVVFELSHPSPGFEDQPLADVPILPAHQWDDLRDTQLAPDGLPVGSGPYELIAYDGDDGYRFAADPDYFRGPPTVASLDVPIISDADATVRALREGGADLLPLPLPEELQQRLAGLGIDFLSGASYGGTELRFNTRTAPFADPDVSRAVAEAIDLDRIAAAIGGGAVPANRGYLHPASPWAASDVLHTADPDAARADLADLDLPALEVLAPDNDPVKREAGRQVAVALRRAGLDAELATLDHRAHADALGLDGATPTFELAVAGGFPLASHDPDFLAQVFGGGVDTPLSRTGYHREAFDAAAERIATTPDPKERQRAVDEALGILADDVPVLPLVFADGSFPYRPRVYDGWVFVHGSGPLDKRSFLPAVADDTQTPQATPPASASEPGEPTPSADSAVDTDEPSAMWLLAGTGGLLGIAAAVAAAGVWRRRRR